jgi:hypothetical protein
MLLTLKTPQKPPKERPQTPYFMPKRILVNPLKKERKREKGEDEERLEREAPK